MISCARARARARVVRAVNQDSLLLVMALGVVLALIVLAQILLLLVRSRKLSAAGRRRSVRGDEPLRLGCCRTATEIENF
jgi:hypothetical protein